MPTSPDSNTKKPRYSLSAGLNKRDHKKYNANIYKPTEGQITSSFTKFAYGFLQEMFNPEKKLGDYMAMAEKDPIVRACIELKCLRATLAFGSYQHEDSKVKEWVQSNFDNMRGHLRYDIGKMASAMGMGFSVSEIVFSSKVPGFGGQWRFLGFNHLDPRRVKFEGKNGRIEWVKYRDGSGIDKRIHYSKVIHIANGFGISFDNPFGSAEHATAYDFYKAKRALLSETMVAGKNNATGQWWARGDSTSTSQAFGANGKPLKDTKTGEWIVEPTLVSVYKQLLNLENNSIIVTDRDVEIQPLQPQTGESFWNTNIQMLDKQIMTCYGVPNLVFNEGSATFGQGTLGKQHRSILDSQIESIVLQIQDQIIEKVVRPLLVFNFGHHTNFGTFRTDKDADPETASMKVNNLISAMSMQLLKEDDLAAINALRDGLDLPKLSEEQHRINKQQELINQILQQQASMGMIPAVPGNPTTAIQVGPNPEAQAAPPPPEQQLGEEPVEEAPMPEAQQPYP